VLVLQLDHVLLCAIPLLIRLLQYEHPVRSFSLRHLQIFMLQLFNCFASLDVFLNQIGLVGGVLLELLEARAELVRLLLKVSQIAITFLYGFFESCRIVKSLVRSNFNLYYAILLPLS